MKKEEKKEKKEKGSKETTKGDGTRSPPRKKGEIVYPTFSLLNPADVGTDLLNTEIPFHILLYCSHEMLSPIFS